MTSPPPGDRIAELASLLREAAGLRIEPTRLDALRAAVERAAVTRGVAPDELADQLVSGRAPLQPLLDEVTVGETYFFRDPAQWSFLETNVLPRPAPGVRQRAFHAWSAGCSTGEEAYTLAVLLVERGLAAGARIVGTDLSLAALDRARRAEYSLWSFRGGIDPRLRRHLVEQNGRFTLDPGVARLVRFLPLNLATPFSAARDLGVDSFDLVLCRNVLIYLAPEVVKEVAARLFASLAPGGWLATGASDPLLSRHAPFRVEAGPHGIAYQRPAWEAGSRQASRGAGAKVSAPRSSAAARLVRDGARTAETDRPRAPPAVASAARSREAPPPPPLPPARSACEDCRALLDAGDQAGALRAVEGALAEAPVDPELHLMRALVLTELGDLAGAESACRRSVYLDRSPPFPQFFLAMLRLQTGERDAAVRGLRTVLALCAERPESEEVPLSSGLTVGALAGAARFQLDALSVSDVAAPT